MACCIKNIMFECDVHCAVNFWSRGNRLSNINSWSQMLRHLSRYRDAWEQQCITQSTHNVKRMSTARLHGDLNSASSSATGAPLHYDDPFLIMLDSPAKQARVMNNRLAIFIRRGHHVHGRPGSFTTALKIQTTSLINLHSQLRFDCCAQWGFWLHVCTFFARLW